MGKAISIRLDDDLIKRIDEKKSELSQSDYIRNSIEHFLVCDKLEKEDIPALRPIISKFRGKCSKPDCGKIVEVGEPCYWAKGIIICMDCMIQKGLGDKTLVAKYLKTRELNRTLKALENECDRLANQIENLTVSDRLENFIKKVNEMHNLIFEYFREVRPQDKERELLETIRQNTEKEKELIRDLETFFQSRLNVHIKRPKVRKEKFIKHSFNQD